MRDVFLHAANMTTFGRGAGSIEALAHDAADPLLESEIDRVIVGNHAAELFGDGGQVAARVACDLGLRGIPALRVEAATASGAAAFAAGVDAVGSGRAENVLVVGVERMTHVPTTRALDVVASMLAPDERAVGATPASLAAIFAARYMKTHGLTRERLADVAVWAHDAGARNPHAQFRKPVTRERVMLSSPISDPLRLFDAAPVTDGAAAILLSAAAGPVRVAGLGAATDAPSLLARTDTRRLDGFPVTRLAARAALANAGWSRSDVDVFEIHDAFSILALTGIEDLELALPGKAIDYLEQERTRINTGGGLKARGHPSGATGVAQLVELFEQLTDKSGIRQVPGARRGLAHNVGGFGATAFVTLLEASA